MLHNLRAQHPVPMWPASSNEQLTAVRRYIARVRQDLQDTHALIAQAQETLILAEVALHRAAAWR